MINISEKIEKVITIILLIVLFMDMNPLLSLSKWIYIVLLCIIGAMRGVLMTFVLILNLFQYISKKNNERRDKRNKKHSDS